MNKQARPQAYREETRITTRINPRNLQKPYEIRVETDGKSEVIRLSPDNKDQFLKGWRA